MSEMFQSQDGSRSLQHFLFCWHCSGLWHRVPLIARVSVLYLLLFCIVSAEFFFLYFKYIA